MKLTLFFRLILMSIFQRQVCYDKLSGYSDGSKMSYDNQLFYCPRIVCKDGWSISLQVHNGNYCESENGYRVFGHTMQSVEFGFPSTDDKDLHKYSEMYGSSTYDSDTDEEVPFNSDNFTSVGGVGRIPVTVIQAICDNNHDGIDWEATLSITEFERLVKGK